MSSPRRRLLCHVGAAMLCSSLLAVGARRRSTRQGPARNFGVEIVRFSTLHARRFDLTVTGPD